MKNKHLVILIAVVAAGLFIYMGYKKGWFGMNSTAATTNTNTSAPGATNRQICGGAGTGGDTHPVGGFCNPANAGNNYTASNSSTNTGYTWQVGTTGACKCSGSASAA